MPESSQTANSRASLLKYAGFLLNRRPYFSAQIRQKLLNRLQKTDGECDESLVDQIITELTNAKYLNDEYLLAGYIAQKLQKLQGPKIITLKLRQLGVSRSQIQTAFSQANIKEKIDKAIEKLSNKYSTLDKFQIKSKLYQRGF